MKMNKKKLAVVSLVLCIAAIISMGSLAWFNAKDTVTNELKFVTEFEMDLYETDEEGNPVVADDGKTTVGQTYDNVRPGATLHKDPTVINKCNATTGEDQYIRMSVTVTNADALATVMKALKITDLTDLFVVADDFDATWKRYDAPTVVAGGDKKGTMTYTFYLLDKLAPQGTATLFEEVKIPTGLTDEQAATIGSCQIIVEAEAMQAADLGEGVTGDDACYLAFTNPTKAAEKQEKE